MQYWSMSLAQSERFFCYFLLAKYCLPIKDSSYLLQ
jgi:hypothetical protein